MSVSTILFTKPYNSKEAKTRLRGSFPSSWVTELHNTFLDITIRTLKQFQAITNSKIYINEFACNRDTSDDYPEGFNHSLQVGSGFGERFQNALTIAEAGPVIIIGSDCPFLKIELLEQAYDSITRGSSVIGPSQNGGFYLLGLPSLGELDFSDCFEGANERSSTLSKLSTGEVNLLKELRDIDLPEDIEILRNSLQTSKTIDPSKNPELYKLFK